MKKALGALRFHILKKKAVWTPERVSFFLKEDSWGPREGFTLKKKTVGSLEKILHT